MTTTRRPLRVLRVRRLTGGRVHRFYERAIGQPFETVCGSRIPDAEGYATTTEVEARAKRELCRTCERSKR